MSCCQFQSNGSSSTVVPPLIDQDDMVAHFDFSAQGNVNLTTGDHTLTSEQGPTMVFNSLQQGTTFDLLSGTGLRFRANATNTLFTNIVATRTAAKLSFTLLDFFTAFDVDASRDYFFSIFCRVLTIPTAQASPGGMQFGGIGIVNTPDGGADRYLCMKRNNAAGVQALGSVQQAAGGANYTNPLPTANTKALGFQLGEGGFEFVAGDWDTAGGQAWEDVRFTRVVANITVQTTTGTSPYKDRGNVIVMAFPTGQVSADMAVDVERLVIRSPR